jgi:LPXTG-motif cell wall-anchored protein
MLRTRVLACAVALFVCLMAAPVSAQPIDKRTFFTFSAPVALPGLTLPAGQYLFRLADPNTSAKVVQVLSADGSKAAGQGSTPTSQASASSQAPTPNQTSPAPSQTTASRPARTQLPRTASSMPIVALIGTVALVSAASLGYWRTRRR